MDHIFNNLNKTKKKEQKRTKRKEKRMEEYKKKYENLTFEELVTSFGLLFPYNLDLLAVISLILQRIREKNNDLEKDYDNLMKENQDLKNERDKLKEHILSSPEGKYYFEAMEHYQSSERNK